MECVHEKEPGLDTFTLQYNAIVYTLQQVCGFRVRQFMLYDEQIEDRRIFLFLNLSTTNRLRVAARFRIKKEVDYSSVDFFLNDPTGKDYRPLKLHSAFRGDPSVVHNFKQTSRFFGRQDRLQ